MTKTHIKEQERLIKNLYQYEIYNSLDFHSFNLLNESNQAILKELVKMKDQIDSLISDNLFNYTIDRLNLVDLAIIRMAVYNLLKKELPKEVIFNLSIEITKKLSDLDDEAQHKFTNRLLQNISDNIK
ncbi:MAG: transcription antitermination factor NusB [Acholeplasmataceae bacterium]